MVIGEFRAGADPELRFAPSGVAVCKIRAVASKQKKDESSGQWVDDKTVWVSLLVFNKPGEHAAESIQKGDLVNVVGKLQVDEWTDREGKTRTSVDVVCDSISPSLKWNATQKVNGEQQSRASRESTPQTKPDDDPWVTSGTTSGSSGEDPPF